MSTKFNSRFLAGIFFMTFGGMTHAKCLPTDYESSACRYPAGDSWCEKNDRHLYAYRDACLRDAATSNTESDFSESDHSSGGSGNDAGLGALLAIIAIAALIKVFSGGSGGGGEKRAFKCHECGSRRWIVTDSSHYDDAGSSYNYKEWLKCAKCGNTLTNERHI
jgi:hypothetical protein